MATLKHPVTGVDINDITLVRNGRVSDEERRTARLLQSEGDPRWLVAAKLGRFPLAFEGTGLAPTESRRPQGGNLSTGAARNDPRQITMEDLFGPDDGTEMEN